MGVVQMLGVPAFAEKWGVTPETVRKWCREGKIKAEQDGKGKPWRIPENETPPMRRNTRKNK